MRYISKEELFRGLFNLLKEVQVEEPGARILLLDSILKALFFWERRNSFCVKKYFKTGCCYWDNMWCLFEILFWRSEKRLLHR